MSFKVIKSWKTKAGLDACILLVKETHHCGYVELPEVLQHLNFTGYNGEGEMVTINVHGGVTWQGTLDWSEGREVIGFDCAHWGDLQKCPEKYKGTAIEQMSMYSEGVWRDEEYCVNECESMAQQLLDLMSLPKPE